MMLMTVWATYCNLSASSRVMVPDSIWKLHRPHIWHSVQEGVQAAALKLKSHLNNRESLIRSFISEAVLV